MKIIAVMTQKGGVGKTMTASSLAYILGVEHGKRVLIADADQQGNISMLYGRFEPQGIGMSELLEKHRAIGGTYSTEQLIDETPYENISIIPANGFLMRTNMTLLLLEQDNQILRFKMAMEEIQDRYDYCIVDCGLLMDMTVTNVLVAADLVILPVKVGGFEIEAIVNMEEQLEDLLSRGFYNPEAAFPAILDQTIEKAYREGHKKVAVTFDRFTKKGSLPDFKTHDNYYVAGPVGEFLEVPENGELKHDVFTDDKLPQRKLKTYGRQFTLSRKAFIDDDISLVTSLPARYAAAARKTINKQVFQILVNNPAIYDGTALFGSNHKNLLKTGTGVTQAAMQTMIMALANQKDQFGEAIIINPAQIVVPSGMKFDMYTLFNSPTINTTDNTQAVNPLYQYRDQIEVVEDPTINALCGGMGNVMPWWLFGAAGDCDGIEVDYLNGQEIPNIRRMEAPGQLGFVWDIFLDWGISVMDYRGMVKNPGVKVETKLELA